MPIRSVWFAAIALFAFTAQAQSPVDVLEKLNLRGAAVLDEALSVEMRDGARLAAFALRPAGGGKGPVILIKTPYRHEREFTSPLASAVFPGLVREGYTIVVVNDRGTQWSEGRYRWLVGSNADGADVLDWIAAQPWSNGRIGTFGCSSSAESQLGLAALNHPAHKAMVVMAGATGASDLPGFRDQGLFYKGGIPALDWAWWYASSGLGRKPNLPRDLTPDERARTARAFRSEAIRRAPETLAQMHLPSRDILRASGLPPTEWDHLMTLAPADSRWAEMDFLRASDRPRVPGLHIDSWYDIEAYATLRLFEHISKVAPDQHLVMGGGPHCSMGTETADTSSGDRTIGDARFNYAGLITRWFKHWLDGGAAQSFSAPRVQYYGLMSDRWMTASAVPFPGTRARRFYLGGEGGANSNRGDGRLQADGPAATASDTFRYDPRDPAPALGGGCCSGLASQEQSPTEVREDVLVYTTLPLTEAVEVAGYIPVKLFISSSAPDTDIIVRLADVHPDGKSYNVADAGLRLRYRDGLDRPQMMEPGAVYPVTIEGLATATRFRAGHRIRLQITSSAFPQYERNLNTGGQNFDEALPQVALNTIHHGRGQASYIEFPTRR